MKEELIKDERFRDLISKLESRGGRGTFRVAISYIAKMIRPSSYLEIGVLAGLSLRPVARKKSLKRLVLCDDWSWNQYKYNDYSHIEKMLSDVNYVGSVQYLNGNSQKLIPTLNEKFDLIGIDGEHFKPTLTADMENTIPLMADGGYIVVDDLRLTGAKCLHDSDLEIVFDAICEKYSGIIEPIFKCFKNCSGVGIIKKI